VTGTHNALYKARRALYTKTTQSFKYSLATLYIGVNMNKNFNKYNRNQLAFIAEYNARFEVLGLQVEDIKGEASKYE